jgi:Protein of unknown function (DUF2380)
VTGPRWQRIHRAGVLLALGLVAAGRAVAADVPRLALFPIELFDTSLQGEVEGIDPADEARLALVDQELRDRLAASGRFRIVDTAPAAAEIERAGYWRSCNGCEAAIAKGLGADLALAGWVQKVSNLILNINVTIRDAATRELVFAGGVDIRGNTDESWRHGIRYLLKHRLLAE